MSALRALVIPRWAGRATDDWYPWICERLPLESAVESASVIELQPNADAPKIEGSSNAVVGALGRDPSTLAQTILIGHSVGCQAVLHALAKLPPGSRVHSVFCIAGWWNIVDPWESINPWVNAKHNSETLRSACSQWNVLLSDDDPFTPGHAQNRRLWQTRLGARVRINRGGKHFNQTVEPVVLEFIKDRLAAP